MADSSTGAADAADPHRGAAIDRRAAIKKTVAGAATAGLVWSAPRVEGLSLRPSYAAAMTTGGQLMIGVMPQSNASGVSSCAGETISAVIRRSIGDFSGSYSFAGSEIIVTSINADPGTWVINSGPTAAFDATLQDGSFSFSPITVKIAFNCV